MNKRLGWFLVLLLGLSACVTAVPIEQTELNTPFDEIENLAAPTAVAPTTPPNAIDQPAINRRVITDEDYSFPSLIPFDGIRPIYKPVFVSAQEAPYMDDELVMGLAMGGEAKAYPVTVLRFREIVNDEIAGTPTLVTW